MSSSWRKANEEPRYHTAARSLRLGILKGVMRDNQTLHYAFYMADHPSKDGYFEFYGTKVMDYKPKSGIVSYEPVNLQVKRRVFERVGGIASFGDIPERYEYSGPRGYPDMVFEGYQIDEIKSIMRNIPQQLSPFWVLKLVEQLEERGILNSDAGYSKQILHDMMEWYEDFSKQTNGQHNNIYKGNAHQLRSALAAILARQLSPFLSKIRASQGVDGMPANRSRPVDRRRIAMGY